MQTLINSFQVWWHQLPPHDIQFLKSLKRKYPNPHVLFKNGTKERESQFELGIKWAYKFHQILNEQLNIFLEFESMHDGRKSLQRAVH